MSGCHNRAPFKPAYLVQDGWRYFSDGFGGITRQAIMVMVPHRLSTDCRYSIDTKDAKCGGCALRQTAR